LRDSLDLLLGEVKRQLPETLGYGCGVAYFGNGYCRAAQRREDGPIARYRRLTQQLHQQNQQRLQQLQTPQQVYSMQQGQVAGNTGNFIANSQLGLSEFGQPIASWAETPENGIASLVKPGRVNRMTNSPM